LDLTVKLAVNFWAGVPHGFMLQEALVCQCNNNCCFCL